MEHIIEIFGDVLIAIGVNTVMISLLFLILFKLT